MPGRSWEDNIRVDLKEMWGNGWNQLTIKIIGDIVEFGIQPPCSINQDRIS